MLLVATVWGLWPGIATGLAAAGAFNFFHLHPAGGFTIHDERNWIALAVLVVAAVAASWLAVPLKIARR